MKKLIILLSGMLTHSVIHACPACEKAQPRILRGITHGAGPDSQWDYLIVWLAVIATVLTLFYSVKWLIRPGEQSVSHIKNSIFQHDNLDTPLHPST